MAGGNGNATQKQNLTPEQEKQQVDYLKALAQFIHNVNSITKEDLEKHKIQVIETINIKEVGKNTYIADRVKEYRELSKMNKYSDGTFIDKASDVEAFNAAAKKFGHAFWIYFETSKEIVDDYVKRTEEMLKKSAEEPQVDNVATETMTDEEKEKTAKEMATKKAAEQKLTVNLLNVTMEAIRRCSEKDRCVDDFEKLYIAVEEKYGAEAVMEIDSATRVSEEKVVDKKLDLPTDLKFRIQMRVWERVLREAAQKGESLTEEDLKKVVEQRREVLKAAKNNNEKVFDKFDQKRYNAAFEAASDLFGKPFWRDTGKIPMGVPKKCIENLEKMMAEMFPAEKAAPTEEVASTEEVAPPKEVSLADQEKLAESFNTAVSAVYRGVEQPNEATKAKLKNCFLTIKENCDPSVLGKIYDSKSFDAILPEFHKEAEAYRQQKIEHGDFLKEKMEESSKVLNSMFSSVALTSNEISELLKKEDDNPAKAAFVGNDKTILTDLKKDIGTLKAFYTKGKTDNLQDTIKNIQENYPGYLETIKNNLANRFEPGTQQYKTSMQALVLCGSTLAVTQKFAKIQQEIDFVPKDLKIGNSVETVTSTLKAFEDALTNAFPTRGSSKEFSNLKDALHKAISGEGTLENVITKSATYRHKKEGLFFSKPLTALGKHRFDVAKKLSDFLDKIDYRAFDKEMAERAEKENAVNAKQENAANADKGNTVEPEKAAPVMGERKSIDDIIHDKCVEFLKAGKITSDQAFAIDIKSDKCNLTQKAFLNKLLHNEEQLTQLTQEFPDKKGFENAIDTLLETAKNAEVSTEAVESEYQNTMETGSKVNDEITQNPV